MQHKYLLLFSRSHFLEYDAYHSFCFVPEFLVHRQVDEEVGDVVDKKEVQNPKAYPRHVKGKQYRQETDDVDEHDKNQLLHSYHWSVTSQQLWCSGRV